MQLNIKITLDNAAYENGREELAQNLDFIIAALLSGRDSGKVHDSNGNKTGFFEIEGE